MYLIDTGTTDPYFNIAAEEYLFRNWADDLLILYINSPSIIVGKHQNALEEINLRYVNERGLPVIRRISGGGTVYHDRGNLNFTFIVGTDYGKQVNFRRFIDPINTFLGSYGIKTEVGEKNEVRSGGLKFSGNAEHVFRNRVLHHGTILFSSDLAELSTALKRGQATFTGKSVQSNRTSVGNISGKLAGIDSTEKLKDAIFSFIGSYYPMASKRNLEPGEISAVNRLADEKYRGWDWNFAYGPAYEISNLLEISGAGYQVWLKVEKGIIREGSLTVEGEDMNATDFLVGIPHRLEEVRRRLDEMNIEIDGENMYRLFG